MSGSGGSVAVLRLRVSLAERAQRREAELFLQREHRRDRFALGQPQPSPQPDLVGRHVEPRDAGREARLSSRAARARNCLRPGPGHAASDVVLELLPHVEDVDDVVAVVRVGNREDEGLGQIDDRAHVERVVVRRRHVLRRRRREFARPADLRSAARDSWSADCWPARPYIDAPRAPSGPAGSPTRRPGRPAHRRPPRRPARGPPA